MSRHKFMAHILATAMPVGLLIGASPACAQIDDDAPVGAVEQVPPQPASEQQGGLDEIIVTAQRRGENLQQVPIAITAITSERLQASGISGSLDLPQLAPGLVTNKVLAGGVPFIRGIGQVNSGFGTELPVALYVDGYYVSSPAANVFSLANIERIEVLRGPQGTLFGRNTSGGVIQIVTQDPTRDFGGRASVSYGNYDTIGGSLLLNVPLSENFRTSLTGLISHQGNGWGENLLTGQKTYFNNEVAVQGRARWTPTPTTTVDLRGYYTHIRTDIGTNPQVAPGEVAVDGTPYLGRYVVRHPAQPMVTEQAMGGITVAQEFGSVTLRSLTGYSIANSDFFIANNAIEGLPQAGRAGNRSQLIGDSKTFTQELQLLSGTNSRVRWIAGLFYLWDSTNLESSVFGTCVGNTCAPSPVPTSVFGHIDTNSYAVFGQATIDLFANTRLTVGGRYTWDEKSFDGITTPFAGFPNSPTTLPAATVVQPGDPAPGFPDGIDTRRTWSRPTWRIALDHNFTDQILGYISYNRGFKSGGYQITNFSNPPVAPEIVDAYEIGLKTELFDRHLRFNVAAFYSDYSDVQLRTSAPPAPPGRLIFYNAAQARIKGVDVDFDARITRNFGLNGGFEYLDAKYVDFPGGPCTSYTFTPPYGLVSATTCDLSGNRMIRSPKFTYTLGAYYSAETGFGRVRFDVNDAYNSGYYFEVDNRIRQDSYHIVNASMTLTTRDDAWSLQLWARNLFDARTFVNVTQGTGGVDAVHPGAPRTYGLTLSRTF